MNAKLWVLTVTGLLALGGLIYYAVNAETIHYNLRLLNAKRVADKFYAEYEGLSKNIAYGAGASQRLDVYRPDTGSNWPVIVFVHGGSWNSGNKELYAPVAQRLLPEGMVVVVPGYTLYPDATYKQQATDIALAVAWVLENIDQYGGDPTRVVVGGQSAGGHLSALALFDEQWLAAAGHSAAEVCGFYGIAGVYDAKAQAEYDHARGNDTPVLDAVMEGLANFHAASPITYVRGGLPPALLIHGTADETVPLSVSRSLHSALQAASVPSELLEYQGAGHSGLLFDALAQNPARLVLDLSDFVNRCQPQE